MATQDVLSGNYISYQGSPGGQYQWLVTTGSGTILSNLIAILVTVALGRVFRLGLRIYQKVAPNGPQRVDPMPTSLEGRGWHELLEARHKVLEEWRRYREGRVELPVDQPAESTWNKISQPLGLGLLYLLLYILVQVLGIITSGLQTNGPALSSHPDAGFYLPNATDIWARKQISLPYETQVQLDAVSLARDFYGQKDTSDTPSYFLNPVIPYDVSNTSCPFGGDICLGGRVQPVRFTTNAINASYLGINAPSTIQINRTTICSPLNMNSTFIRLVNEKDSSSPYGYYYGPTDGVWYNTTWWSNSHTSNIPMYDVHSLFADHGQTSLWKPIAALEPAPGAKVTIIFISSQKIYYIDKSDDPIFPATEQIEIAPSGTYWCNPSRSATVVACMDWNQWRNPQNSSEWISLGNNNISDPEDEVSRAAKYLTLAASLNSNIFSAIDLRMASALLAQSRIQNYFSLPLAADQWRVETQQLYETSLARILIQLRNAARGVPKDFPGYVRFPGTEKTCDKLFLFSPTGWVTIDPVPYWFIFGLSLFFVVLAAPVGDEELVFEHVFITFPIFLTEKATEKFEVFSMKCRDTWEWLCDKWRDFTT